MATAAVPSQDVTFRIFVDSLKKLVVDPKGQKEHKEKAITYIAEMADSGIVYKHKQIRDSIHGPVNISNLACAIIDTEEFQRMRSLHQLGTAYKVYPTANHSRYEHSIGVYFLAGSILESIKKSSDSEHINNCLEEVEELKDYYKRTYGTLNHYKLDQYVCELIKLAALCHDIGHGPFSHVFDDVFIPKIKQERNISEYNPFEIHEHRSCQILECIIKRDTFLQSMITDDEIKFMQNLINPTQDHQGFVYQIVSNSLNGIDVDKFDYLIRDSSMIGLKAGFEYDRLIQDAKVIDNKICFQKQMQYEVYSIFSTRYRMHLQVYSHKAVVAVQGMISDIMVLIDPVIGLYDSITEGVEKFCKLTDSYILETVKFLYDNLDTFNFDADKRSRIETAHTIYKQIESRQLYKCIDRIVTVPKKIGADLLKPLTDNKDIPQDKILIHQHKIGFVSGNKKNPIQDIYLYSNSDPTICFRVKKGDVSHLVPNVYQENVCMVFVKDKTDEELIKKVTHAVREVKEAVQDQF